jgi:hypothetical protein
MAENTVEIIKAKLRPVILTEDADALVALYLQLVDEHGNVNCVMALDELLAEDEKAIEKDGVLL